MHIKVYGIQRTGTNYIYGLMSNINFIDIDKYPKLNDLTWKHNPVPINNDIDEVLRKKVNNKAIIVIKNPYTWYTSIVKWIKSTPQDWPFGNEQVEQVFKRYNNLYMSHKNFLIGSNKNTVYTDSVLIRYEDLITDAKCEMQRVVNELGMSLNNEFKDIEKTDLSDKFTEERRNYYIKQLPIYSNDIIERVNNSVDWELMKFYGYKELIL